MYILYYQIKCLTLFFEHATMKTVKETQLKKTEENNMQKEWSQVAERITQDDRGKQDWYVPVNQVRMNSKGIIGDKRFTSGVSNQVGLSMEGMFPNDHALSQLSSRVGIPSRYARKCMDADPKLLANHFNHWMEGMEQDTEGDRQWLLRGKVDELRGVLTDKYSQLDNRFIFDTLGTALDNGGVVDVKNFDLTSKYLNLRLVFPSLTSNIGTIQNKDDVMVGIHITNSEVGSATLRIDSCLFRLVCSNGMIARVGGESLMEQRHIHLSNREIENRVVEAVSEGMELGDLFVNKFAMTKDIQVKNPLDVLNRLAKNQKYSREFTDTLKSSFNTEPDSNAFGIVNALTRASQVLPFDRRLEVETFAGVVMDDYLKGVEF